MSVISARAAYHKLKRRIDANSRKIQILQSKIGYYKLQVKMDTIAMHAAEDAASKARRKK